MVVCKFWSQGNCKHGANCRFEHPGAPNTFNSAGGRNNSINNNSNNNNNNNRGGFGTGPFGSINRPERWELNEEDITSDLTKTTPKWILSAYGPGKQPPASLFLDNEFSPEEIRWRFYNAQATGNAEQADMEATQAWQKAQNDIANAAQNVKAIQDFMTQRDKQHPNRYDYCKMDGTISAEEHVKNSQMNSIPGSSINPFGTAQAAAPASNPFSNPAFGQSSSPFGQAAQPSAFGQPSQPSAFGKPAFGQASFGQPAAPQPTFGNSPFSKPAAPGNPFSTNSTATPSPFSQTGTANNAFSAQPTGTTSGFGQTSSLGTAGPANPFGKPSAAGGFGQQAFGQTAGPTPSPFAQTATAPSGFGQTGGASPSPFGGGQTAGNTSSPFAQAAAGPSGFGAPSGAAPSPFGGAASGSPFSQAGFGQKQPPQSAFKPANSDLPPSTNPFKAPGFGQNPFNQNAQPAANPSPFGAPQTSGGPSGFDATSQRPAPGTSAAPANAPDPSRAALTDQPSRPLHYTQTIPWTAPNFDGSGKPVTYRGLRVKHEVMMKPGMGKEDFDFDKYTYDRPDGRGAERIWFPKANAEDAVQKLANALLDFQADDVEYTDDVKNQYKTLFEQGSFAGGRIPLVPPMREWIAYDI